MMGIVTLHLFSYAGMGHHWIPRLCTSCVVGFVFISGYFGVKFSLTKLAKLYGVALFCATWCGVSVWMNGGSARGCLESIVSHLRVWWFVNAYIMLMLMAPMINYAMESSSRDKLLEISAPILILVFGWEFLTIVPSIREWIPADRGFGTHSGLTLVGIYVASRLYRLLNIEQKLSGRMWLFGWVVSGVICALNFGKYNSPFALIFAAASFALMKRLGETKLYGKFSSLGDVCVFLGPSMLSVYLLHVGGVIHLLWLKPVTASGIGKWLTALGVPTYPRLFLAIIIVFAICVVVDLARRAGLSSLKRIIMR